MSICDNKNEIPTKLINKDVEFTRGSTYHTLVCNLTPNVHKIFLFNAFHPWGHQTITTGYQQKLIPNYNLRIYIYIKHYDGSYSWKKLEPSLNYQTIIKVNLLTLKGFIFFLHSCHFQCVLSVGVSIFVLFQGVR